MLTKSKEQIAWDAYDAALRAMKQNVAVGYSQAPGSMMGMLTELIALAVQAGVAEMLNSVYTNEEFERDLTLKS